MTIRVKKYLVDAQMAASAISDFLKGKTRDDYFNSLLLRSGVERQFEIIGEALKQASQEKEDLELDIPELWKIVGLRNRIIHGYDSIDGDSLWDLTQVELPLLEKDLAVLISA